ncbi:neuromodulin [Chrysoperla carnea]|uniref:neuromodulin n=1 Tax=Chrysoperla carnea TaxID=189513 RepID=UPI001D05FBC4|nr:neuromodulin [Chrysoperla carnea]
MGCNTSQEAGIHPIENTDNNENQDQSKDHEHKIQAGTGNLLRNTFEDLIKDSKEAAEAATKIQAVFRGHRTRKTMKAGDKNATPSNANDEKEPTREELEAEFRADDKELCHAATKIQASFRGHMSRKADEEKAKADVDQALADKVEEVLDIDLTDPDLNTAATKIQASFRGHKVRKETEPVAATNNAPTKK